LAVNYAAGRAPDGLSIGTQIESSLEVGLARVATVLQQFAAEPDGVVMPDAV
jgi:hypothetical protein